MFRLNFQILSSQRNKRNNISLGVDELKYIPTCSTERGSWHLLRSTSLRENALKRCDINICDTYVL